MNKKAITIAAIVVVIVLGLGGWALYNNMASAPSAVNSDGVDTTQPEPDEKDIKGTITYTDNGFVLMEKTFKKGDHVRVVNESSTDLQFSSDNHPTHTKDPELNLPVMRKGEGGTLTLTRVGTWGFHNHLKDADTGLLTVTE